MFLNTINSVREKATSFSQRVVTIVSAPTQTQTQIGLFTIGMLLIVIGLHLDVIAQDVQSELVGTYNDERVSEAVNRLFGYIEGSFGALIMVAAGLGAIMAAALGSYSSALGLLVVAVGAFILRSLVGTFFNTDTIG